MTARKMVSIHCDYPDCLAWDEHHFDPKINATDARLILSGYGWKNSGSKDLCPDHSGRSKSGGETR
mgnify:CR=1 FL=1